MTISFNNMPDNIRVPLVGIEFDGSRALQGTPGMSAKILVIGQKLTTGTASAGVPIRITSKAQAEAAFGRGSMLSAMFNMIKKANPYTETWAIPLADHASGVPAAGYVGFSGTVTQSGTLCLYIAGTRIAVAITSGQAPSAIATAVAAAINAVTDLPVTAAVNGSVNTQVDITCRWDGETGNDIDIRVNYYPGEALPAGLSATISNMAAGATNPDISSAITAMGDEWWNYVIMPYTDATNLTALEEELASRWLPMRQVDGIAFCAYRGTHANTETFGDGRNSALVSCMGTSISPSPAYLWAAAYGAVAAYHLAIDPARPLKTLPLPGILPPAISGKWTIEERNLLLYDGISTFTVDGGGNVLIEQTITMYQENAYGVADESFLKVYTPATLSYFRYSMRARITTKYPRHKLADDGTQYGAGQAIVTPSVIRAELIALFKEWMDAGLAENLEQFKRDLIVERNADNRNRVDVLSPPDIVNQFDIFAAQIQFVL
ncbi:Mu-like prophage FluMu tail sheath protein [uncultured Desulfobacterium sp.]|uniref:Mu-like prophage FluMu tail sheath protein n=1 Tax=uncultured Desulfobacterium sp. TaxID=201089 RepID=A0A445MWF1_9BACT|nr:Mu-like prophage FluMu tail sheath protein [uncultured Desulfobacterium sp.]